MPIFDQGYQHWDGSLSGHGWRWLAITRQGVRSLWKNMIVRILLILAYLPAMGLVTALALWGLVEQQNETIKTFLENFPMLREMVQEPVAFRGPVWTLAYWVFFKCELYFIMILVLVCGPNLISRDLRFNALPLYLSRPLTRFDYFAGKLGVIGALVAAVAVGPAVLAYVLGLAFSLDLSVLRDTYHLLLGAVGYGLVIVVSAGTLMLALSSLSRRSLYVGIAWFGFWLIGATVGTVLGGLHVASLQRDLYLRELRRIDEEFGVVEGKIPPPPEGQRWNQARQQAWVTTWAKLEEAKAEAARSDWRPLCSYTANLDRLGDTFLDTEGACLAIGRALVKPQQLLQAFGPNRRARQRELPPNERRLADALVNQYPWQWSAGILAALLGLSLCTLSQRVKSLDRLK